MLRRDQVTSDFEVYKLFLELSHGFFSAYTRLAVVSVALALVLEHLPSHKTEKVKLGCSG